MTIKITYDEAVSLLKRAVEEKGEDYVYLPANLGACHYFDERPSGLVPSCIVGHVFAYKGVNLADIDHRNDVSIRHLVLHAEVMEADDRTLDLLMAVQGYQDRGEPWGRALELALHQTCWQPQERP